MSVPLVVVVNPSLATRTIPEFIAYAKAHRGKVNMRPGLPTVGEFVPSVEATHSYGVVGPKGTPVGIVDTLNKEIRAGLVDSRLKERFAELGGMVLVGSPADFAKLIADEMEKWAKVIRAATIKQYDSALRFRNVSASESTVTSALPRSFLVLQLRR